MTTDKMTLLEIVQRVSEVNNTDIINSITDTEESMQIARIVRDCYHNLLVERRIKTSNDVFRLIPLSDVTRPTYCKLDDAVYYIDCLKYKNTVTGKYTNLTYVDYQDFVDTSLDIDSTATNVQTCVDMSGITLNVYNDRHPSYYTLIDDEHVIFDSYNKAVENTIMAANIVAYGVKKPDFQLTDTFVPDIAAQHFQLLVNQCKVAVGFELKNFATSFDIDTARRQKINAASMARRVEEEPEIWKNRPRHGRK